MNTSSIKAVPDPAKAAAEVPSQPMDCGGQTMPQRGRQGRGRRRHLTGVTSIEYALMGSLIATFIVSSISTLGTDVLALWVRVATELAKVM